MLFCMARPQAFSSLLPGYCATLGLRAAALERPFQGGLARLNSFLTRRICKLAKREILKLTKKK